MLDLHIHAQAVSRQGVVKIYSTTSEVGGACGLGERQVKHAGPVHWQVVNQVDEGEGSEPTRVLKNARIRDGLGERQESPHRACRSRQTMAQKTGTIHNGMKRAMSRS
jgi:hypothetical protein